MSGISQSFIVLATIVTASCFVGGNDESTIKSSSMMSTLPTSTDIPMIDSTTTSLVDATMMTTNSSESIQNINISSSISSEKDSEEVSTASLMSDSVWECPNITRPSVECSCDFPHTLRCTGERTALNVISEHLKSNKAGTISLLDVTVTGISILPARFLENIGLHGLVVSSGELTRVHENAFTALARPLQALGLPNNLLESVPTLALEYLTGLDRLDLSHNKLKTLEADSFSGLSSLTYLDLCDNLLSQLSPQAFAALPNLRFLRMRGNRLSVSALSALRGLKNLEELDLSSNLLLGPMGPNLLPWMPRLHFLSVSENEFINVQQGALNGARNLSYLILSHNQIDVLEDHSFKHLSTLTKLDLANNRIVDVSSASLAHLEKLTNLDLMHNFLRSLTADLVVPLKSLEDLRLDDNEITMVSNDVPISKLRLKRLSLADNPLNCDCTLLDFATWLSNSSLSEEDKSSAVCATPPTLENGILTQISPGSLLCGEPSMNRATLKEYRYNQLTGIHLLWNIEPCTENYTCDTLIVYETVGDNEVQTESNPLHCDPRMMKDPCSLPVTTPPSFNLQLGHKYRYCVVLFIPTTYNDESLGLGCSDVITLEETKQEEQQDQEPTNTNNSLDVRITAVHVNVSDQGSLHVNVGLSPSEKSGASPCEISIVVFNTETAIHKCKLNCSLTFVSLEVLVPGHYKVCASLDDLANTESIAFSITENDRGRSRCVEVQRFKQNTEAIILIIIGATCALLIVLVLIGRNIVRKIRHPRIQTQCFLPAQEFEITHKAHYIKLLATTKV
ncbi:hypothetical protein M0804_003582 [Polistes exclamans]|nr:hypothetical protein M0804_003582 [Polistes exclamans]